MRALTPSSSTNRTWTWNREVSREAADATSRCCRHSRSTRDGVEGTQHALREASADAIGLAHFWTPSTVHC